MITAKNFCRALLTTVLLVNTAVADVCTDANTTQYQTVKQLVVGGFIKPDYLSIKTSKNLTREEVVSVIHRLNSEGVIRWNPVEKRWVVK